MNGPYVSPGYVGQHQELITPTVEIKLAKANFVLEGRDEGEQLTN